MKKSFIALLALLLALSIAACSATGTQPPASGQGSATADPQAPEGSEPVAEEVRGATIPAFAIQANGVEITQDSVADCPMYSVQAKSVNSTGTESTVTYVGFAIKDVLKAAGLNDSYSKLEAIASDGYSVTLSGDIIYKDTTLLAMSKDGSPFAASPWMAPCSDKVTGNYLKGTVSITVSAAGASSLETSGTGESLPEILDRTGMVEFAPFSFLVNGKATTNETLDGLSIYKITAVSFSKTGDRVESGYTGYKLSDVLSACGANGSAKVKAIANDGYETELTSELVNSAYTLVAIEKDKELGEGGTIWLAPCSETASNAYCKLVVEIAAE